MKQLKLLSIFLLLSVTFFSCVDKNNYTATVTEIELDVNKSEKEVDISPYLEDQVEVIALETTEQCLISEPIRIIYGDKWILIAEQINQSLYLFDETGKFVHVIGKQGRGPNEYTEICDVCVIDSTVYVADINTSRIVTYNLNGESCSPIKYDENICFEKIFSIDNEICFVTNHTNCKPRHYNLLYLNLSTQKVTPALPFDGKKAQSNSVWGLDKYTSSYKDTTLLTLPTNDTIFAVTSGSATPKYTVTFSSRNLPSNLKNEDAELILKHAMAEGLIKGVERIENSKNILFINYLDGKKSKDVIYEKQTGKYKIGDWIVAGDFGSIYCTNYATTNADEFIVFQDASMFLQAWEGRYSRRDFKNEYNKQHIEKIVRELNQNSNPVILRFKFK